MCNQTSSTSRVPVLLNCSQLPAPLCPHLFLGHCNITSAKAICTACIQLRHQSHSFSTGTVLDWWKERAHLARDWCADPPWAARLHVPQHPASKLVQGCMNSAACCAFINISIVLKLYYLFQDKKLNQKIWANVIILKSWLQQEDFSLKILLITAGWTPNIQSMCIQKQNLKKISKCLFMSMPCQCDSWNVIIIFLY